jgi:4-hydroxybenzoate polyprenyltransferase
MQLPGSKRDYNRPLVVDVDGALVRSDLLWETAFRQFSRDPFSVFTIVARIFSGKASVKHHLAQLATGFEPQFLPYDESVLAYIRDAVTQGRSVYLASASNESLVKSITEHLGLFTGYFASNETHNLSGEIKARRLVAEFGEGGFDYIGNDRADLPVWARAAKRIAIRTSPAVLRRVVQDGSPVEHLAAERPTWRSWIKLLRVHQYTKNVLLFVPLVAAHQFNPGSVVREGLAFIAFSLCASSVYLLNDLLDLQADRKHPTKQHRPLASGQIPIRYGVAAMPFLFLLALMLATLVRPAFLVVLLSYFALSTAYSFVLKRKMLIDVAVLAMLYVARVLAGAVAIDVPISEWLLAFSMFIFTSLALIKRYVELTTRVEMNLPDPANRNYKLSDLDIVAALAAAAGFNAITVFALYISSSTVHDLYRRPALLWLICPVLLWWISRALMMAHRRLMHDDPIVFAVNDRNSILAGIIIAVILLAAT